MDTMSIENDFELFMVNGKGEHGSYRRYFAQKAKAMIPQVSVLI